MCMNIETIKQEFKTAWERFVKFIQNPWYQIKKQPLISPEALTYYIIALSVVPILINIVFHFGFWSLISIATIPFMSLISVGLWLVIGYIVHMIVFHKADKKYDLRLVANLAAFSNTFWILTQTIPYVKVIAWLFGFILFCESYSERMELPKSKVYIAFAVAALVILLPFIYSFRYYRI